MQTTNNNTATMKIFTIEVQIWDLDEKNKLYTKSTELKEVVAADVWEAFKLVGHGDCKSCKGSRAVEPTQPEPIEEAVTVTETEMMDEAPFGEEEAAAFDTFRNQVSFFKEIEMVKMANDFRQIRFGFSAGDSRAENLLKPASTGNKIILYYSHNVATNVVFYSFTSLILLSMHTNNLIDHDFIYNLGTYKNSVLNAGKFKQS